MTHEEDGQEEDEQEEKEEQVKQEEKRGDGAKGGGVQMPSFAFAPWSIIKDHSAKTLFYFVTSRRLLRRIRRVVERAMPARGRSPVATQTQRRP